MDSHRLASVTSSSEGKAVVLVREAVRLEANVLKEDVGRGWGSQEGGEQRVVRIRAG